LENKKLTFLIDQNQITLLYLQTLQQTKTFIFKDHEIIAGRICNMTKVAFEIRSYLQKNKLLGIPVVVLIKKNLLTEFLVSENELQSNLLNSAQIKLCISKDKFYVAKIHPSVLLQYQILLFKIGVYLEEITGYDFVEFKKILQKKEDAFLLVKNVNEIYSIANNL
jgi:hypothetical protein